MIYRVAKGHRLIVLRMYLSPTIQKNHLKKANLIGCKRAEIYD